ncbi:hypothetical protein GCM10011365_21960 [Marinicella pacifica]|uniref:Aldehyde dehydrogenase domain-containing protein n=1 Tax=Marinicella pacifica TaxID=1171543 RepID=A0A917CW59_9GAMM|nr:hypothetical protein GCM10011365_21960 [Marinicella pacifica]
MTRKVSMFIDGEEVTSQCTEWIPVTDPATQEVICEAPNATEDEVNRAVASAKKAFETWKNVPVTKRARMMLTYQHLLKKHHDEIAEILAEETGKNFEDAKGDVWRGIEVAEHAANMPSLMMGETVENVATNVDTYSMIQPLGVCAGMNNQGHASK